MTINELMEHSLNKKEFLVKGDYFVLQGRISSKIGRLNKGILRGYIYDYKKQELTTHFYQPGDLIFATYDSNVESVFNVQALDFCEISILHFSEVTKNINNDDKFSKEISYEFKHIIDKILLRFQVMVNLTPSEKFLHFIDDYPNLQNEIPCNYIANYLDISLQELNMLRLSIPKNKDNK